MGGRRALRISCSDLAFSRNLKKNNVKTVSFNADGNILVSGSNDKQIKLWDWKTGIPRLTFESGHEYLCHSFRAKTMAYTDDRILITCVGDGQVRHARISEFGVKTRLMAKHQGSPHLIYACGEDGLVQHIDLTTAVATELLRCQPIGGCRVWNLVIPLYAIAIDPRNLNVFAVVGSDQYARLYDIRKYKCHGSTNFGRPIDYFYRPHVIVNTNDIFRKICLAFLDQSELLVSYRDNSVYLFTQDMGLGNNPVPSSPSSACSEANGKATPQSMWLADPAMAKYTFGRRKAENLFVSMKEHILLVDCIESHPYTAVLASSGADGIKI
ncbi:hypothetical protein V6N13_122082 [Hibiscus sabdariffa]